MIGPLAPLIGVAVIALVWLLSQRLYGEVMSPIGIYFASAIGTFSLYLGGFVDYYAPSPLLWGIFLMQLAAFAAGAFLADRGLRACATSDLAHYTPSTTDQAPFLRRFLLVTGALGTIGWTLLLYLLTRRIPVLVMFAKLYLLDSEFQSVPVVGYLNVLNVLVIPAFVILWKRYRYLRAWTIALALSAVVGLLLAGIKAYITFGLVTGFLAFFSFNRSPTNILRMAMAGGVMLGLFLVYDVVIDFAMASQHAAWVTPYLYLTGGWPALGEMIKTPPPSEVHPALFLLYPFWKIKNVFVPGVLPSNVLDFVMMPFWFNVYTMAGEPYLDFGLPGIFGYMLLMGFIATRLRRRAVGTDRVTDHLVNTIWGYFLVMSFFANMATQFYSGLLILYVLVWRLFEPSPVVRPSEPPAPVLHPLPASGVV